MYTSIDIDFEVYKAVTAKLKSPEDTYNDVLRRQMGLGVATSNGTATQPSQKPSGRPFVWKGVQFPHGTKLRAMYSGTMHHAEINDGAIVYKGDQYTSPSAAAGAVTGTSVNGWKFWECKLPGHTSWQLIDNLRRK